MEELWLIWLAGFLAALADGSLGMGFGPTSSSLLLTAGVSPSASAATVNIAKVITGVASAGAHWRCGNVDRRLVLRLAVPGAVGAALGVAVLTTVDADAIRPVLALLLLAVGCRLLVRFSRPVPRAMTRTGTDTSAGTSVGAIAAAGGVTNAMVGAWGPVVTPSLLHRRVPPHVVVGSVNTAEIVVAVVSVGSLIASVGSGGVDARILLALLAGGVVAAPIAARLAQAVPARLLGVAIGTLLVATQVDIVADRVVEARLPMWVAAGALTTWAFLRPRIQRASFDPVGPARGASATSR